MIDPKTLRKQLRNVCQDLVGDALAREIADNVYKQVMTSVGARLTKIEENVRETLGAVDRRSKDSLSYLVRNATAPAIEAPLAPKDAPAPKEEE